VDELGQFSRLPIAKQEASLLVLPTFSKAERNHMVERMHAQSHTRKLLAKGPLLETGHLAM
jgi:hypothetical protein